VLVRAGGNGTNIIVGGDQQYAADLTTEPGYIDKGLSGLLSGVIPGQIISTSPFAII